MSSETTARTLAATAVIAAAAVVIYVGNRAPGSESEQRPESTRAEPILTTARPATGTADDPAASAAATRLRELNQLSETFRNTTFLIAIRDAGFVCNELLGVYGGVNDSATWTASCSEMLAYTVRVAQNGGLGVEPVLQHLDGLPFVPPRDPGGEILLPAPAPR